MTTLKNGETPVTSTSISPERVRSPHIFVLSTSLNKLYFHGSKIRNKEVCYVSFFIKPARYQTTMPAPTVLLVKLSIMIKLPVVRLSA